MPRRALHLLALVLVALACVSCRAAEDGPVLRVTLDRPDATYTCGQQATFRVEPAQAGAGVTDIALHYTLTEDGGRIIAEGAVPVADGRAIVNGTLGEPGFLRLTATWEAGGKTVTGLGGAAFEPERIGPAAPEPADFVSFWEAQKRLLAAVPIDAQVTEMPALSDAERTVYKVSLANIDGSRVHGWLAVPTATGPHPAVLTVPWAGVYPTPLGLTDWSRRGFLAMAISAHDADIDLPQAEYDALNAGALAGYPAQGRDSRETYYFRRVFLGCVRAVDYLTARGDWNGQALIVTGSSQGGGLSLVTAGLDSRVTAIAANVPALCDHLGHFADRQPGWPRMVTPGDAAQERTAPYFDAVHFARHVTCPAIVGVGFVDVVCAPSGVFAAYNALGGPKQIVCTPSMGHSQSAEYGELLGRWIPEQGQKGK